MEILGDFKKDIDSNTLILGDFNTPLSTMDRSSKQNINKDIVVLDEALRSNGLNWYIESLSSQRNKIQILFKRTWNIFKDRPHDRTPISHNKFKKIEIISSTFSDHKGMKLENNLKKKTQKHSKSWRLNSMLLNNEWVKNEIREEIKKFLETNENNSQHSKTYGAQQR